mmetsp:Transcript_6133/g.19606  ORF Transcript_6133/g.19606 Transcript_6133/m.19606 type:complete len:226 (-) Transcript_6133:2102-2779(-)
MPLKMARRAVPSRRALSLAAAVCSHSRWTPPPSARLSNLRWLRFVHWCSRRPSSSHRPSLSSSTSKRRSSPLRTARTTLPRSSTSSSPATTSSISTSTQRLYRPNQRRGPLPHSTCTSTRASSSPSRRRSRPNPPSSTSSAAPVRQSASTSTGTRSCSCWAAVPNKSSRQNSGASTASCRAGRRTPSGCPRPAPPACGTAAWCSLRLARHSPPARHVRTVTCVPR